MQLPVNRGVLSHRINSPISVTDDDGVVGDPFREHLIELVAHEVDVHRGKVDDVIDIVFGPWILFEP